MERVKAKIVRRGRGYGRCHHPCLSIKIFIVHLLEQLIKLVLTFHQFLYYILHAFATSIPFKRKPCDCFKPIRHGLFMDFSLRGAAGRGGGVMIPLSSIITSLCFVLMTMKFGTIIELDVLYTMLITFFVTSSILRIYEGIAHIYEMRRSKF